MGRPKAPGGAQRSRVGLKLRSGDGLEGDLVAEGLELADVAADGALGAAALVVVVGSEIDELGVGIGQEVPDDGQDGPSDRDDGFLLAPAAGDASVAFAEESVGP